MLHFEIINMIKWIRKLTKNSGMAPSMFMKVGSQLHILAFPKCKKKIILHSQL